MSSNVDMTAVRFAYRLAELWSDFIEWHEAQPAHNGGTTVALQDEDHEPTFLEFMDWIIDQVEALEPQIQAMEAAEQEPPA